MGRAPGLIEPVPGFDELGIAAFTTTRLAGDFSLSSSTEPAAEVFSRWLGLGRLAGLDPARIACAHQVHGATVIAHDDSWEGFYRHRAADGHFTATTSTLLAVTLADCVPIFLGHPSGCAAVLHSGWRGTAANIVAEGLRCFTRAGHAARDVRVFCGPSICAKCYEVSADVFTRVTGVPADSPRCCDLRETIRQQALALGVRQVDVSASCSRCDIDRFFSHRGGDAGRMVGVVCTASS